MGNAVTPANQFRLPGLEIDGTAVEHLCAGSEQCSAFPLGRAEIPLTICIHRTFHALFDACVRAAVLVRVHLALSGAERNLPFAPQQALLPLRAPRTQTRDTRDQFEGNTHHTCRLRTFRSLQMSSPSTTSRGPHPVRLLPRFPLLPLPLLQLPLLQLPLLQLQLQLHRWRSLRRSLRTPLEDYSRRHSCPTTAVRSVTVVSSASCTPQASIIMAINIKQRVTCFVLLLLGNLIHWGLSYPYPKYVQSLCHDLLFSNIDQALIQGPKKAPFKPTPRGVW